MEMDGRVTIVTGGASGMGEAVVEQLLCAGASVVAIDLNEDRLMALSARIGSDRLATMAGDVALEQTHNAAVDLCIRHFGHVDGLVNCAGIGTAPCALEDAPVDEFDRIQGVNLKGTFLAMRAVLPHMKARGRGSIVNISSIAGIRPLPKVNSYTASKWGVVGLSMSVALESGPDGVRVNTICPGVILTPMIQMGAKDYVEQLGQMTPMRRIGQASEVAEAVIWLLSDRASFVTGAVIPVDGGQALV